MIHAPEEVGLSFEDDTMNLHQYTVEWSPRNLVSARASGTTVDPDEVTLLFTSINLGSLHYSGTIGGQSATTRTLTEFLSSGAPDDDDGYMCRLDEVEI